MMKIKKTYSPPGIKVKEVELRLMSNATVEVKNPEWDNEDGETVNNTAKESFYYFWMDPELENE